MAEVVGSISVVATINTKGYDDGKKRIEKGNNDLEGQNDKVGASFDKLGSIINRSLMVGAAAFGALSFAAVKQFADYEQLVGGVETLFKSSAGEVEKYANNAYKTAGLSANKYMETVTSFSASLLQGLGGDTAKAAKIGDMAVTDMSDNANKMGTSMEMIQYAYQGFAKDNYTMLDNLKLGYGGTAGEMARLVNDSGVLGDSFKATAENVASIPFDKQIEAIHKIQTEMGITGTTAKEASGTISGSWNSLTSAWNNVLTGIEGSDQQLSATLVNFASQLAQKVPPIVSKMVTGIITALKSSIDESLGKGAFDVMATITVTIGTLVGAFAVLFNVIKTGQAVVAAFNFVLAANPIGLIILAIAGLVAGLVYFFTQTKLGKQIFSGFMSFMGDVFKNIGIFIANVVNWIKANWPLLLAILTGPVGAAVYVIASNVDRIKGFFSSALNWIKSIWSGITGWFSGVVSGIAGSFASLPGRISSFAQSAWNGLVNAFNGAASIGRNIISGIVSGLNPSAIIAKMKSIASSALGTVKSFLGIRSPSRVFRDQIGKQITTGLALGIDSGASAVYGSMSSLSAGVAGTSFGIGGKYEAADIVHKGEYVVPKQYVNQSTGLPEISSGGSRTANITNNYVVNNQADAEIISRKQAYAMGAV